MSDPILVAEDLSISFGDVRALKGVDVTIARGEVRCLAGENGSGKSTFVKIVSGVYAPTGGTATVNGRRIEANDPRAAIAAGVQVIYQDLSLFDHLSVAENIAMNAMLHHGARLVSRRRQQEIAAVQLERMRVDLPLDAPVGTLSMANKQLVAIARALSLDARILFMDEPTTALTTKEVKRLLTIVHELKESGLAIVFISHKLDEVFEIADTITVFRDGAKVGDFAAEDLDSASLSYHMTGREVLYNEFERFPRPDDATRPPLLEVRNLTRRGNYRDISFAVRAGDIVGLTGLLGAGRTELALSLYGLNKPDSGEILVNGRAVRIEQPWDAIDLGIALVPEDRGTQGLFGEQSTAINSTSPQLDKILTRWRTLDQKAEDDIATGVIDEMRVNNKNPDAIAGRLSGGNQQKVVIGKWIATDPAVFILDSPTVGIDIGSKAEIYDQIQALTAAGMGVVLISDEPEEIVANCNRVIVMHEGDVIATFGDDDRRLPGFTERLADVIADPTSAQALAPGETR
ncbi:ATP-binding cassette domain-containing protein [Pseudactinotalea sp. HY160]|uniref:sugar ABC transporter ATP-binding protein n=1 Tax=Pseudactinotalea sp. HY160 TaxID=2654490 RepID=UPI00128BCB5F|nr:sugar ABC transporter ATP-binding protein [Pseudactinotalea sp. HY160]MPV49173.1 ATP-binding cassette domain-containing protein [Pseudactinotalea sp. HY160]